MAPNGLTQRDLHIGLAKEFLDPLKIGTTLEMLNEKLTAAMKTQDTVRVLAISQLITRVEAVTKKQGAAKE